MSIRTISNIKYSDEFGNDYIDCYCHKRQERRTFKISRIDEVDGIRRYKPITPPQSHTSSQPIRPTHHRNQRVAILQLWFMETMIIHRYCILEDSEMKYC